MKIKQTLLTLGFLIAFFGVFVGPTAQAAKCGGVETSILTCETKGACVGGEDPFEGEDPKGDSEKSSAYIGKYSHTYGLCAGDVTPNTDIENSGVWGVLLVAINILTAGIGILAVAGIVYGSILYTSSGGNPENTKKAMTFITNVVIGIVAYGAMFSLLNFIIPGGLFT